MRPPEPPALFDEPWQAEAFSLAVHLHEAGAFSWEAWTSALSGVLERSASKDERAAGASYYEAWLEALESLVLSLGLIDDAALLARRAQWAEAYRRTPHGEPVSLQLEDAGA